MKIARRYSLLLALTLAAPLGCDDDDGANGDVIIPPDGEVGLTDGEIAAVMLVANQGEVDQATAALPNLVLPEIIDYAEMMIDEHSLANEDLRDLMQEEGIVERQTDLSLDLFAESEALVDALTATTDSVDALYIDSQVEVHDRVLTLIDEELLPSVESAALEGYLTEVRFAVEAHLTMAEDLSETIVEPTGS